MKRVLKVFFIIVFCLFLTKPMNTYAVDNTYQQELHNQCANSCISASNPTKECIDECVKKNDKCGSLLGDPTNEESIAWMIQQAFNIIKFGGPFIVLVLSSVDFAKTIVQNDEETMKKAQKKLIMRLIIMVLLFFVPDIVFVILNIFGITTNPTCGIS